IVSDARRSRSATAIFTRCETKKVIRQIVMLLLSAMSTVSAEALVLKGGTIWPSPIARPIRNGTVLIEDGRITAVGNFRMPKGARVLDCSGATILAGFWNSHVHFFETKWENAGNLPAQELEVQLRAMVTRYGFTSVFDIGSAGDNTRSIRRRIQNGEVTGP